MILTLVFNNLFLTNKFNSTHFYTNIIKLFDFIYLSMLGYYVLE